MSQFVIGAYQPARTMPNVLGMERSMTVEPARNVFSSTPESPPMRPPSHTRPRRGQRDANSWASKQEGAPLGLALVSARAALDVGNMPFAVFGVS